MVKQNFKISSVISKNIFRNNTCASYSFSSINYIPNKRFFTSPITSRNVVMKGLDSKSVRLPYTKANYPMEYNADLLIKEGDDKEAIIKKLTARDKRAQHQSSISKIVNELFEIQEKRPEIKIVWTDPAFWPTGQSQKVVWYCKYHDCLPPLNPDSKSVEDQFGNVYSHLTPDGKPAYFTFVKNFIETKKRPEAACCPVADEIRKKAVGYGFALKLLEQRGKVYGTVFTMPDIKSSDQWVGKRLSRKGNLVRIPRRDCSLHGVTEERKFETLLRHCACPCSLCRTKNQGSGKIRNFPKIVDRLEKHAGPHRKLFRKHALSIWGPSCQITGLVFKANQSGDYTTRLEAHHLCEQSSYSGAKKDAELNSVMLLSCIHQGFHTTFLNKPWDSSYDPASVDYSWEPEANPITFLEFLLAERWIKKGYSLRGK